MPRSPFKGTDQRHSKWWPVRRWAITVRGVKRVQYFRAAGASRFVVTLTACLVVLVLLGLLTVRHVLVDIPGEVMNRVTAHARETAVGVAEDIAGVFQVRPTVVVDGTTFVEQDGEVLEVSTWRQKVTARHRMEHSWLHSTKTFEVAGDFSVNAGFDLSEPFVVEVERDSGRVRVALPPAKILSADLREISIERDENGLWNKLTAADRESAIGALRWRAIKAAERDDILEKARASAEERLRTALGGREVTFDPEFPTARMPNERPASQVDSD
jgi:hypothetical protein